MRQRPFITGNVFASKKAQNDKIPYNMKNLFAKTPQFLFGLSSFFVSCKESEKNLSSPDLEKSMIESGKREHEASLNSLALSLQKESQQQSEQEQFSCAFHYAHDLNTFQISVYGDNVTEIVEFLNRVYEDSCAKSNDLPQHEMNIYLGFKFVRLSVSKERK